MRRHIAARAFAALALVMTLAACGNAQQYPVTPDAARAKLAGTIIPDIAFGKAAHSDPGKVTADGVQWAVEPGLDDESPGASVHDTPGAIMILRAKLMPAANGTEVTVDLAPRPGIDPAELQAVFDQHPAMARMFRSVAMEQVDSVLTARPFDYANIRADMALAVLSELPNIRQQLDEAAAADEQRDRDTIHHAYDEAK